MLAAQMSKVSGVKRERSSCRAKLIEVNGFKITVTSFPRNNIQGLLDQTQTQPSAAKIQTTEYQSSL